VQIPDDVGSPIAVTDYTDSDHVCSSLCGGRWIELLLFMERITSNLEGASERNQPR